MQLVNTVLYIGPLQSVLLRLVFVCEWLWVWVCVQVSWDVCMYELYVHKSSLEPEVFNWSCMGCNTSCEEIQSPHTTDHIEVELGSRGVGITGSEGYEQFPQVWKQYC